VDRRLQERSISSDRDQAQNGERGCPATFRLVPGERRPTPVSNLEGLEAVNGSIEFDASDAT
jgi:hypothetical protein